MVITRFETKEMTRKDYFDRLNTHDWYYNYSDDHSVWRRGSDNACVIFKKENVHKFRDIHDAFMSWRQDESDEVRKPKWGDFE